MLLRMAWRNVWRNLRRTLITLSTLTFGVFAIVFSSGAAAQTTITTDGGQFAKLFNAYLANPAPYPK